MADAEVASESRYRALFEALIEAFCVIEMIFDDSDRPVDFRYLETNPAFEAYMGVPVLGKRIKEIEPEFDQFWIDAYGRVARTGDPAVIERAVARLGEEWFHASAFRLGGPGSRQVGVLFENITERKRAEAVLRASEARQAYLVHLDDALRSVSQATDIQQVAARVLGAHLGASRAMYADVVGEPGSEVGTIRGRYLAETDPPPPEFPARYDYGSFGERVMALRRRGATMVVRDVLTDPEFDEAERNAWVATDVRAAVTVSLVRGGRMVADFGVQSPVPRDWTPDEVALVEATADRTWAAVERARVEQELRVREERYRTVLRASPIVFAQVDPDLRYEWIVNQHPDFDDRAVVGKRDDELDSGPGIDALMALKRRVFEHGREERERITVVRSDGFRTYDVTVTPIHDDDGRVWRIVTASLDVTEADRTERELRASEERFRTVADLVPDLLWRSDPDGNTTWVNQRCIDYTGQTLQDAGGWGWVDGIHPDDRDRTAETYASAFTSGEPLELVHRVRRADGEYRWLLDRMVPIRDDEGRIQHWFGTATDVHEQLAAQELLEERVEQRTREVRELTRRLTMAEQDQRREIGQVLHDDLQQLLYGIEAKLGGVLERSVALEPEGAVGDLEDARRWVQDAIATTRRLTVDLSPPILRHEGLADALEWLRRQMEELHGMCITVEADERYVLPDEVRVLLFQTVRELLFNVHKHAGTDRAVVRLSRSGGDLVIHVVDEGRGFDPAGLADGAGRRGIGLYSFRERLQLVGGRLEVDSRPNGGTRVEIRTPLG